MAYCPHCDGPLFKGKRVAVIGGGNSGVEAVIDPAGLVGHVTLLEFGDQLRADAVLVSKLKSLPNVVIHTGAQTTEITGAGGKVNGLSYTDRANGAARHVELEGVFVQIGLVPNSEWLKGALELSRHGEIVVDNGGQTSLPGVFAAGDSDDGAVQADHHRDRRRREGGTGGVRPPDSQRGARMRDPASTRSRWAAAPGRPKQGPTLLEGRSPYSVIGVRS